MNDGTPEPRRCAVCGGPLRSNNTVGVCRATPECEKERWRRNREAKPKPEHKSCDVCGSRLNLNNQLGVCGDHSKTACMKERKRREALRDGRAAYRIVVNAGDTFGRWTALEDYGSDSKPVLVRCECGNERRVLAVRLLHGRTTSCGCSRRKPRSGRLPYLTAGAVFSRLTVLDDIARCEDYARFRCECGGEITTKAVQVKLGFTRSCGCLRRENRMTHGFSKHPLYSTWRGIIGRCTVSKHQSWHNYGGRADVRITICELWRTDPWAFAEDIHREIGPRPAGKDSKGRALYELDRKDNDGGYWCSRCPECTSLRRPFNVQWSTKSQQGLNQRKVTRMSEAMATVTRERDAFAARVTELEELLADCKCGALALSRGSLF